MRFFGDIQRVSSDEERMVWGYASTEQRATDGLVITRDAVSEALADYMAFANIREMHQLSAVGVAREASVDDGGLFLGAWVQDDAAWNKVKSGVYRGFSIGAKITARDPDDETVVRGVRIHEISLVDRPADPGATFQVFRAADSNAQDDEMKHPKTPKSADAVAKPALEPAEDVARTAAAPVEPAPAEAPAVDAVEEPAPASADDAPAIEPAAETAEEAAVAAAESPEASVSNEDPVARAVAAAEAAQAGLSKVFDDVERAAKGEVAIAGLPGADIRRGLCTLSYLGCLLAELCYVTRESAIESAIEGDASVVPEKLRAAVVELVKAYRAMTDEEMAELLKGVSVDVSIEAGIIQLAAAGSDIERAASSDLSAETVARLQSALDGLIARGFKPSVDKVVDAITGERDTLLRTVTGLTDQMTTMAERLSKIEAQPLPPKTAGAAAVARAVGKAEDVAGPAAVASVDALDDAAIKAAFDAMSNEDKALILTRAALQRPHVINRR